MITPRPRSVSPISPQSDESFRRALCELRQEATWIQGGVATCVLAEAPDRQVILTVLKPGARTGQCQLSGRITLQVVSGRIFLEAPRGDVGLSAGSLQTLPPSLPHDIEAIEESVLLVTLYGPAGSSPDRAVTPAGGPQPSRSLATPPPFWPFLRLALEGVQ